MDARISAICSEAAQKSYDQLLPKEQAILTHFQSEGAVETLGHRSYTHRKRLSFDQSAGSNRENTTSFNPHINEFQG